METPKEHATRILYRATERIMRMEPMLIAARTNAAALRCTINQLMLADKTPQRNKILSMLQDDLRETENEEAEYFNMLQDEYKDRRKSSEWLSAEADRERRAKEGGAK